MMSEVAKRARFRLDPNRGQELFDACTEYAEAVRSENGTTDLDCARAPTDSSEI